MVNLYTLGSFSSNSTALDLFLDSPQTRELYRKHITTIVQFCGPKKNLPPLNDLKSWKVASVVVDLPTLKVRWVGNPCGPRETQNFSPFLF